MLTLESRTISVLKNFATINKSIMVREGNVLATIHPNKTIVAQTEVAESFPTSFAIYDLSKFLGVIALLNDPEIEFDEDKLVLRKGKNRVNFTLVEPSLILAAPDKPLKFPTPYVSFDMPQEVLAGVIKAMGILDLPEMAIVGNGDQVSVDVMSVKNASSDSYSVSVGATDQQFRAVIKREHLCMMPGSYHVEVAKNDKGAKMARFTGVENGITYFVAVDAAAST